jgi:hypothetical protein
MFARGINPKKIPTLLLCGPIYFHSNVSKAESPDQHCVERYPQQANQTVYHLSFSTNEFLHKINFWWFSIVCKIAPCAVLFLMSILILKQLKAIKEMSARFANADKNKQHNRTTKIILVCETKADQTNLHISDSHGCFYLC